MAEGLYLDGVPEGQWNFWDENGSQESNDIRISLSELKINTAKTGNDVASTDKIDYPRILRRNCPSNPWLGILFFVKNSLLIRF